MSFPPLSNQKLVYLRSLHQPKNRQKEGLIWIEGTKMMEELFRSGWDLKFGVWNRETKAISFSLKSTQEEKWFSVSEADMKKLSFLQHPPGILAVAHIPDSAQVVDFQMDHWYLYLEEIQDPGNMGTMIRLCDWFGFRGLIYSAGSVDPWQPKSVQASMGSVFRIPMQKIDRRVLIDGGLPLWAADVSGTSIYSSTFGKGGILCIGNEGKGLSSSFLQMAQHQISIPSFGAAESLNAAMAAGICMSEIRRRQNP